MDWNNKVAVVTGAGSGIGRAIVKELASKGCSVALVDINEAALLESIKLVSNSTGKFSMHRVDVTNQDEMAALPANVLEKHAHIDLVFNNAGITIDKPFSAHTMKDLQFIINLNLWGVVYGCHYFIPYLLQRPQSHIINTSSLAGFLGIPTQSSYCLTKAGVRAFSESLFAEYKDKNLHVMSVHPGAIRTNIFNVAIANSDNPEDAKKLFSVVAKVAMDPDKAARKIIRAVEKKRQRVIVGMDAKFVEIIKRLLPVGIHHLFALAFRKRLTHS